MANYEQLKLDCLKLAASQGYILSSDTIEAARSYLAWLKEEPCQVIRHKDLFGRVSTAEIRHK